MLQVQMLQRGSKLNNLYEKKVRKIMYNVGLK